MIKQVNKVKRRERKDTTDVQWFGYKDTFLALLHSPSHLLESSSTMSTNSFNSAEKPSQRRLHFFQYKAKYRVRNTEDQTNTTITQQICEISNTRSSLQKSCGVTNQSRTPCLDDLQNARDLALEKDLYEDHNRKKEELLSRSSDLRLEKCKNI